MTEENKEIEQESTVAVSEPVENQAEDTQVEEPKMVPLAALEAERRKRQELQEYLNQQKSEAEKVDPTGLVENRHLQQTTAETKREILETLYQDMNPKAVQEINKYLEAILEKKPWLAASVDNAMNRYARAYEIVEDYRHLVDGQKPSAKVGSPNDAARIVQNAQKPRSPVETGKSAQPGGMEYLKSIQGKKEFREYRQNLLKGGRTG